MIYYIWAVAIIAALVLYRRQVFSKFSKYGVKHTNAIPFMTMVKIILRREHYLTDMEKSYNEFKNEKFIGKFVFFTPTILLRDLELIKKVTIKDVEYFLDRQGVADDSVEPIFTRSLIFLRGQEWKDMRSTVSPAFTSSKMRHMVPFMDEIADQMLAVLKDKFREADSSYLDIDCKDLTTRYANDVIASCAFGLNVNSHLERDNQFFKMGLAATSVSFRHMIVFFIMQMCPPLFEALKLRILKEEVRSFFINLVQKTMEDREARNIVRPDMTQLLMQAKKGNLSHEETAEPDCGFAAVEESTIGKRQINRKWADIDLIAQAVIFFFAGFDIVSTSVCYGLHELALNPDVQERLVKEIEEHDAQNDGKVTYNSILSMKYLDMVVSEILRYWPTMVTLERVCTKDSYNLGTPNGENDKEYIVRKGDVLTVPVWCIHRNPEYYPNPDKFDPERFSDENKRNIKPMTYLPFGSGPRNCIGSRFALIEVKILLYKILKEFEVSPCAKTCVPSRLTKASLNPRLEGGYWLRYKLRK